MEQKMQENGFEEAWTYSVSELLEEIDALLQRRFPDYYARLQPGMSETDLNYFEAELGIAFPEDYKTLLCWKNGAGSDNLPYWNGWLCGREAVLDEAAMLMEVTRDPVFYRSLPAPFDDLDNWWNPKWIPLINVGTGDLLCLDTVGSFNGTPGQIIRFIHDDYFRIIEHQSIQRWLLTTCAVLLDREERGIDENSDDDEWLDEVDRSRAIEAAVSPGYPIFFPS